MPNPIEAPVGKGTDIERLSVPWGYDESGPRGAVNTAEGLTQQSDTTGKWAGMSVATSNQGRKPFVTIPLVTVTDPCGALGRRFSCNRPNGHSGRHSYVWRNAGELSGRVRAVWS